MLTKIMCVDPRLHLWVDASLKHQAASLLNIIVQWTNLFVKVADRPLGTVFLLKPHKALVQALIGGKKKKDGDSSNDNEQIIILIIKNFVHAKSSKLNIQKQMLQLFFPPSTVHVCEPAEANQHMCSL